MTKPRMHHDGSEDGLKPRKIRGSKHQPLITQCLDMAPGDWFDLPVPRDRGMDTEKRRIARVLDRYVRREMPEYLFRIRLTDRRKIRVSCHVRPQRGRLSCRTS